jgi:hypothetical protein
VIFHVNVDCIRLQWNNRRPLRAYQHKAGAGQPLPVFLH